MRMTREFESPRIHFTGPTGIDQRKVMKKEMSDTGNKCRK
jgi:hypothetical protein